MKFVGIDVALARLDVAVLDEARRIEALPPPFRAIEPLVGWLCERAPDSHVAIDAPQRTREGVLAVEEYRRSLGTPPPRGRYATTRECDYELMRRGLPLYSVPAEYAACPGWMQAGFRLFEALLRAGPWTLFDGAGLATLACAVRGARCAADTGEAGGSAPEPSSGCAPRTAHRARERSEPRTGCLLEVYPFAAFAVLLDAFPPPKSTPAGRQARLQALAERLAPDAAVAEAADHHALDALAAAYTAWSFGHGQATWVGNPREGLMVLPGPLRAQYRRG